MVCPAMVIRCTNPYSTYDRDYRYRVIEHQVLTTGSIQELQDVGVVTFPCHLHSATTGDLLPALSSTTRMFGNTHCLIYTRDFCYNDQIYHNASNHHTDYTCTYDSSYNDQTHHTASNHHTDYTCTYDSSYNDQTYHNAYN
ncbi:uncharacterized protein LOC124277106 [Haliotis rubra]|uniref:uncharacterized protein LOC124277106 n=1 Tax=Haliotis rubra TaxID=36100 RepID=UPI001EE5B28C|nr:uncharacterized protein LOC124277106 [Haliotis rubra]